jgi:hypothetical protein
MAGVWGWRSPRRSFADCPEFDEMERLGQEWRVAEQDSFDVIKEATLDTPVVEV